MQQRPCLNTINCLSPIKLNKLNDPRPINHPQRPKEIGDSYIKHYSTFMLGVASYSPKYKTEPTSNNKQVLEIRGL